MLYITTRNHKDVHTSYHALCKNRGACGGLYIPMQPFLFTSEEISSLKDKSFSQCVADILNRFFSARLDPHDIECCIGSQPLKLIPMSHKITISEIWNNPDWSFSRFVRNLNGRLLGNADNGCPSSWTGIAVRIAMLFGIFANLERMGLVDSGRKIDVSVCAGDFSAPMAAWYARKMGLPIGMIVFSCNENSSAWDLLHHGQVNCGGPVIATLTPECDIGIPEGLEWLIYETLGENEVVSFASKSSSEGLYTLSEDKRQVLSEGLFGAVIGQNRTESIIRNVYRTSTYLLGPYSALAYGGLQDYRATNGETGPALILTENGPMCSAETVANAIGITKEALLERIRTN